MGLSPAEWEQVEALLPQALDLPRGDRERFLSRNCKGSDKLRAELESLIAAGETAEGFLQQAVGLSAEQGPETGPLTPGTRLGPWQVGEKIGRGGMGEVYAARRADGQFEMDAALKILKRGLDTDELLARFTRERNILARLSHPNIARLVDAGATDDHRPYFVMERVAGRPITAHCRDRGLGVREVLALMRNVCEAVDSAHRNLVVHRDLKPSNVLVTEGGEVKLLDFGVAKVMAEEGDGTRTQGQDVRMTPAYAAPEQILGGVVSTATDVYALGVMLFQLLTGRLPHQREGQPLITIVANLRTETTERPSRILARAAPGRIRARELAGDLDLIVLKALHAEPARRYRSAHDLGADLQRYLDRLPVEARPDSLGYRLGRLLQRHPLTSAAAAVAVLALVTGFGVALWQGRVAREQARAAEEALATANAVSEFVDKDLLGRVDPGQGPSRDLTVRGMLDRAADTIDVRFKDQPLAAAQVHATLGRAYVGIGEFMLARPQLEQAVKLYEQAAGPMSPGALDNQFRLIEVLIQIGEPRLGCQRVETLKLRLRDAGLVEDERFVNLRLKAVRCSHAIDPTEARAIVEELERKGLTATATYASALGTLSGKLYDSQNFVDSARVDAKLVALSERTLGAGHPMTISRRMHYVGSLTFEGKLAEADKQLEQARADALKWSGEDSASNDLVRLWETILRIEQGRFAEAAQRALAGVSQPRARQRGNATRIAGFFLLGEARLLEGRPAEAIDYEKKAIDYSTELGVPKLHYEIPARTVWADALLVQGKVAQARDVLAVISDADRATLRPGSYAVAMLRRSEGLVALKLGHREAALAALKESRDVYEHLYGPGHWRSKRASKEYRAASRG